MLERDPRRRAPRCSSSSSTSTTRSAWPTRSWCSSAARSRSAGPPDEIDEYLSYFLSRHQPGAIPTAGTDAELPTTHVGRRADRHRARWSSRSGRARADPAEVLIEVSHCGICGSDLHFVMEGWGGPAASTATSTAASIAAVGDGVERLGGRRRVVGGARPVRACASRAGPGDPSLCVERDAPGRPSTRGAFARYTPWPRRSLLRLPEGVTRATAALAEPLAVALHAVTRSGHRRRADAPWCSASVRSARWSSPSCGAGASRPITVVEPSAVAPQLARDARRRRVLAARRPRAFAVHREPEQHRRRRRARRVRVLGQAAAMEAGLAAAAPRRPPDPRRGRHRAAHASTRNRILLNELTITGSFVYDADGFDAALELLATRRAPDRPAHRAPTTSPSTACSDAMARLVGGDRRQGHGRSPPIDEGSHDRSSPHPAGTRGSTTWPEHAGRRCSTRRAAARSSLLRRGVRLEELADDDRGPPQARAHGPPLRPVRVPDRQRRADAGATPRPLRPVGAARRATCRRPTSGPRRAAKDPGSTSSTAVEDDPGLASSTRSTSATSSR